MIKIMLICVLLASCATIDMEKSVTDQGIGGAGASSGVSSVLPFVIEPEIIYIERPVFVPQADSPPQRTQAGTSSVRASNENGIIKPQDYSHAAMIYDYNPDFVYEVFTQPLRVTDVCLEPGETVLEAPFVSDSERWILGGGASQEQGAFINHIYIKPVSSGLSASLIINTNRRVYRIILRSYNETHMPLVRWRYVNGLPHNFSSASLSDKTESEAPPPSSPDPRFMSFNYRVTYNFFGKPHWLPDLVFDDGSKTYIRFPAQVLQRELPALFENRRDVLNYRVLDNLIVIDKLTENLTVKIERKEIAIKKKRG